MFYALTHGSVEAGLFKESKDLFFYLANDNLGKPIMIFLGTMSTLLREAFPRSVHHLQCPCGQWGKHGQPSHLFKNIRQEPICEEHCGSERLPKNMRLLLQAEQTGRLFEADWRIRWLHHWTRCRQLLPCQGRLHHIWPISWWPQEDFCVFQKMKMYWQIKLVSTSQT